ncbi:hypothetical protein C8R47DRAFT_1228235 [Mycena vitilis]|nr:hypothetical protein C8R47DRAFT_1228235 [Mycena vitilis]
MTPKPDLEARAVYVTLGFPLPVGVGIHRKNESISSLYPPRTTFVFKVRDEVLAAELLDVQHNYLDVLKDAFPSSARPVVDLSALAANVYRAVPTTAVARPLYPIATGAVAPFVMVHPSEARVYRDTACAWRRVECIRDALVYMILGGNDTSILSLRLNPIAKGQTPSMAGAALTIDSNNKPKVSDTPQKKSAVGAAGTPTSARKKPHCRVCGQPCKGHPTGPCQVSLRGGDVTQGKARTSESKPSPISVGTRSSVASWATESAVGESSDSESVPDSATGSQSPNPGDSSAQDDIRRAGLGSFASAKKFVQALGNESQIQVLVMPKKSLIDAINFLTLEGFQCLIDKSLDPSTIHVYFGKGSDCVNHAYLAQSRRGETPLSGTDRVVCELLAVCERWDVLSYHYTA